MSKHIIELSTSHQQLSKFFLVNFGSCDQIVSSDAMIYIDLGVMEKMDFLGLER